MSWALIAHSAIEGSCSGIMAASEDICDHISADENGEGVSSLFIFPDYFSDPAFYLWRGTIEDALAGTVMATETVAPEHLQTWIDKNGEPE